MLQAQVHQGNLSALQFQCHAQQPTLDGFTSFGRIQLGEVVVEVEESWSADVFQSYSLYRP